MNKLDTFTKICFWVSIIVCTESLIRVGYSPYPVVIIILMVGSLILFGKLKPLKDNEGYSGENDKLIEVNKRIVITRDDGVPYLIRRSFLTIGKLFSLKYHQILQSDEACSHDHPWPFLTVILKGGYYEWTPVTQKEKGKVLRNKVADDGTIEVCRWHGAGSIMFRPANWRHRLELKENKYRATQYENGNLIIQEIEPEPIPAHTFVITGRVIRDWGFFTKTGWKFWKDYNKRQHC